MTADRHIARRWKPDIRLSAGVVLLGASITFQPIVQSIILATSWTLPDLLSAHWPFTDNRRAAWMKFRRAGLVFVVFAVVLNGIFGHGPRLETPGGGLSVEGMDFGLRTGLRLLLIATAFFLVIAPLPPLALADRLSRMRLPEGIPMAVLLAVRLLEELPRTIRGIRDAQVSRGVPVDGNPVERLLSLRLLVSPLVLRSLSSAIDRATALRIRGLTAPPSFEETPSAGGVEVWSSRMTFSIGVFLILYGIAAWLGLLPPIG